MIEIKIENDSFERMGTFIEIDKNGLEEGIFQPSILNEYFEKVKRLCNYFAGEYKVFADNAMIAYVRVVANSKNVFVVFHDKNSSMAKFRVNRATLQYKLLAEDNFKDLLHDMRSTKGKLYLAAMFTIAVTSLMAIADMLFPDKKILEPSDRTVIKKGTQSPRKVPQYIRVRRTRYIYINGPKKRPGRRKLAQAWFVRGHYRTYRSGKMVWVRGHVKTHSGKESSVKRKVYVY